MERSNRSWFDRNHSLEGPDFRWKLADKHHTLPRNNELWTWVDEPTRQAMEYLRMMRRENHASLPAQGKFPLVAAATELLRNKKAAETFKLSILGNLPQAEISSRLNIDQTTIETAEMLFFDIRGKREATSWMTCRVFVPVAKGGDVDLAVNMRLAFFGGPVMARVVLDARHNLPAEDAQRLVDQQMLLHGKLQAALDFSLNEGTCSQFIKLFLDYDLAKRRLEFAREKFQHKCELSRRQHEAERHSNQLPDDCDPSEQEADATSRNDEVTTDLKLVG